MEWSFFVRLSDVSAKGVSCPQRTPTSMPFFRLDFDGKIIQSELNTAAGDPSWSHKASFEYRLVEPTAQDAIASLCLRSATMQVLYAEAGSGREVLAGRCTVDLFSLASGSCNLDMYLMAPEDSGQQFDGTQQHLASGSSSVGRVSFKLSMAQQSVCALQLDGLTIRSLPYPVPAKVSYAMLSDPQNEIEGATASASLDPHWDVQGMPKVLLKTTLEQLYNNTLRLYIRDASAGNVVMAVCDLPMHELLTSNTNHTTAFKRNAYADPQYQTNFTALVTGSLHFEDIPVFAQLATGSNNNGAIHGRPLLDACPIPPKLSRLPTKLPQNATQLPASATVGPTNTGGNATPRGQSSSFLGAGAAAGTSNFTQLSAAAAAPPPQAQPMYQQQSAIPAAPMNVSSAPPAGAPGAAPLPNTAPVAAPSSYSTYVEPIQTVTRSPRRSPRGAATAASVVVPGSYYQPPLNTSTVPPPPSSVMHPPPLVEDVSQFARARSPMADASGNLHRQHQEAVESIEQQHRRVTALTEDLIARTEREEKEHESRMLQLDAEEQQTLNDLKATNKKIEELRLHQEEIEVRVAENCKSIKGELAGHAEEMDELTDLATHLTTLLKSVGDHAQADESVRIRARQQAEHARTVLEHDTRNMNEVEDRIIAKSPMRGARLGQQPSASSISMAAPAATAPGTSDTQFRTLSPRRPISPGGQHSQMPSSSTILNASAAQQPSSASMLNSSHVNRSPRRSPSRAVSPTRPDPSLAEPSSVDVDRMVTAVEANDSVTFLAVLRRVPKVIFGSNNILHIACAAEAPNIDIVSSIVSMRRELVNAVDSSTGNTPLHFACSARRPSVEVLDALLAAGADVNAHNNDGLSPFHVCVLNISDADHKMKRYLLFKGPVNVNALTSKGESPVHLCVSHDRYLEALQFLVNNGASTRMTAMVLDGSNVAQAMSPLQKCEMYGRAADSTRRFLIRCEGVMA